MNNPAPFASQKQKWSLSMAGMTKARSGALWLGAAILAGTILFTASTAFADQIYLKIAGIAGESKDPAHPGWIQITGFSVNKNAVTVTKKTDRSSPALASAAETGKPISLASIDNINSAGHHSTIVMHNVLISGVQNLGGNEPTERVTLQCAKISRTP
jgi:type VI protein secretion system component Hcp